jgi:uncharacterized protein
MQILKGQRLSTASTSRPEPHKRPLKLRIHTALRWLHVYLSMISLLAVLFFSVTGVTLNHPEWTFGNRETQTHMQGSMPAGWHTDKGTDWLKVSEFLREKHHVHGLSADRREDDQEASVSFRAPGYAADVFIDIHTGSYKLQVISAGLLAQLNDLHKGRDAGHAWSRVIDACGYILILVSVTGILLLLYLKKMRVSGLLTVLGGCILLLILMRMAL